MSEHKHPIIHIELSAHDHKKAGEFYSSVFGWETLEFPEMNYTTFMYSEKDGGGFNPVGENNPAGTIMIYIHTDNLEESLKKIEAHGGKVTLRHFEIPTVGDMATFEDPSGNVVALLKPLPSEE